MKNKDTCIVCGGKSHKYFSKYYGINNIEEMTFMQCEHCGFVYCFDLYEMDNKTWQETNEFFHRKFYNECKDNWKGFPPYLQQATFINLFVKSGFLSCQNPSLVDYGSGIDSILYNVMKKYYGFEIIPYEKFTENSFGTKYVMENPDKKYDIVFSSALLEHIRSLDTVEEMVSMLKDDGVLMFHTFVNNVVPQDPNWFYIEYPVHCSLFTYKSWDILMEKYSFEYSIYCPMARTWTLFKNPLKNIDEKISEINKLVHNNYLVGKKGFVDYWK